MSDLIGKKALIDHIDIIANGLHAQGFIAQVDTLVFIRDWVESGELDADDSEVQRLREALNTIAAYDGDFLSGEDAEEMRSIARSLSPQKGETPND